MNTTRKRHKVKARRIGQGRFPNRVLLNVVACINFQRRLAGCGRMRWHEEARMRRVRDNEAGADWTHAVRPKGEGMDARIKTVCTV